MKVYQVLLLLGALVVTVARVTSEDAAPECRGNPETDRWRKDCNWCSCRNGRQTCTRRTCPQGRQEEGPQCEGHPSWKEDCNDCVCAEGKVICSTAYCWTLAGSPPATVSVERQMLVCEEGSRWRDDCNWCVCEGGQSRCTTATCTDWSESTAVAEGVVQCHGTSRWKKDCNWCNCVNGRGVCTLLACIPPERDPFHNLPEGAVCVPGSRFKEECNWCSCGETGRAACTLIGCLPGFKDDGPTCEDGAVWKKDECNICRCINGTSACSKRLCRPEEDPGSTSHQLPQEPQCQGDPETDRWRQDCNWCRCLNGVGACTRRLCREGRREEGPECEGNPSWKKYCNTCSCVNGTAVCTLKFCGSLPPRPSPRRGGPERQCQGDSETDRWRQDCNWCRCRNGVGTCTRKLCREGAREGPECEGNPSWKKDCNTCSCVNGNAICTTKFCGPLPARPAVHREAREPECQGDPETDRWTEDCNSCQCRNGVAGCTKKLCRNDEENLPVCEGNPSWKKDCNRCHCNNGTALCTTMFCGGPLATPRTLSVQLVRVKNKKQECEDGSRWRVDCNWCSCYEGRASCTRKSCLGQKEKSDEPECEGDATWKRDCNWCTCGDGLALCTRMACLKPAEEPCTEGTSWREDCNICRCSQGFVLCTKMACVKRDRELECQGDSCGPSQLPDLCNLPPVSGSLQCTAFFQKWSFFVKDGQCKQIVYGGCGGTANLFNTKEECEAACPTTHAATTTLAREFSTAGQSVSAGGERCTLPQVAGPCFAAFPRYAYNAKTGSCEPFLYGGCMGNANNFMTEEECITACKGAPACDKSKCPWYLWEHYLAKECVPQYADDACCPTSFSCQNASESGKDPTKCYYKGVTYNLSNRLPVEDPCSASCTCLEAMEPNLQAAIECANVECPELFQPPPPSCRLLYRADRCCPYDRECSEPGAPPLESRSATCVWKNKTFHEGDKMYFNDVPCRFCICGPGFTDPYGPGCSKLDCGLEFRYNIEYSRGCTPIRFETNGCCPISWMCPDDSRIDPQQQQKPGTVDELAVCHLGERRLQVGETLGLKDCTIECRCVTPPELTCTKYRSCELAQETAAQRACQPLECGPGCRPLVSGPKQCPTCSCSPDTFSCPAQTCPSPCHSELDLKTGCPSCKCKCPSEMPCPTGCPVHTVLDEATGCPYCECKSGLPQVRSSNVSCPVYPHGRVPCPQDCAIIKRVDENGCEVCECDPNDTATPFGPHHPPPPPSDTGVCPGEGQAPCPMDCGIIRRMDENSCEVCECDPNDTETPFGPHHFPPPPSDTGVCPGEGQAPCPMDCGIIRRMDENSCEVCECDPDDTNAPPTPCRTLPDGRAPCPMDCAIIRYKDENGCEVCKCDPTRPGTPFGPFRRPLQHEV